MVLTICVVACRIVNIYLLLCDVVYGFSFVIGAWRVVHLGEENIQLHELSLFHTTRYYVTTLVCRMTLSNVRVLKLSLSHIFPQYGVVESIILGILKHYQTVNQHSSTLVFKAI